MTRAAAQKYLPSWHARQRQRQRHITATDVLLALMCGVPSDGYDGCTVYTGSTGIRVIVNPADHVIVTVTHPAGRRPAGPGPVLVHSTTTPAAPAHAKAA